MYVMAIHVHRTSQAPIVVNALYEKIAEMYKLPAIETLLSSLNNDVTWFDNSEVYYLENMKEQSEKLLFEVRFFVSKEGKNPTSIFLNVSNSQVHAMLIRFPARGNIVAASNIIGYVKSIVHTTDVHPRDISIKIEGFKEMGDIQFIRESSLPAFVWIDGLKRYIHVREDPREIKGIKIGYKQL